MKILNNQVIIPAVLVFTMMLSLCSNSAYTGNTIIARQISKPGNIVMEVRLADTLDEPSGKSSIIENNSKPVLLSKQFSFTEGPAVDRFGNVFFTDQPNDKIWKYGTDGTLSLFLDKTGRSNGMYFDRKGNLLTCADERNELWSITPKGKVKVILKDLDGHRLNGPNDLWVHPKGGIYFTDPYYQRPYWDRKKPDLAGEHVYYLPRGKKEAVLAAANLVRPNGIVGTPDGKQLYVADINDNKTYRYTIGKNGGLQDRELFVNQGSDGMTIDNQGNVYLTGKGVTVYNPKGEKIEFIEIPQNWTANVCFGGEGLQYLFITASTSIYLLKMQVHGVRW